jgi:phosphoglycolate phosphatase
MKHKLIIFDWDGTLMDSAGKIVDSIQAAARLAKLPIPHERAARDVIGLSLGPAIKKLFNFDTDKQVAELIAFYKAEFVNTNEVHSSMFVGAQALLESLRSQGRLLAVATGKGRQGLDNVWQQSKTAHYFHTSRCADDAESKPSPDMLLQILDELSISPEHALMVGDTSYDMAMAESIDMDRVGVSFGVHDIEQLQKHSPLGIINKLEELHTYL